MLSGTALDYRFRAQTGEIHHPGDERLRELTIGTVVRGPVPSLLLAAGTGTPTSSPPPPPPTSESGSALFIDDAYEDFYMDGKKKISHNQRL